MDASSSTSRPDLSYLQGSKGKLDGWEHMQLSSGWVLLLLLLILLRVELGDSMLHYDCFLLSHPAELWLSKGEEG